MGFIETTNASLSCANVFCHDIELWGDLGKGEVFIRLIFEEDDLEEEQKSEQQL